MICVVILGPTFEAAFRQISQAVGEADLVELRLDAFERVDEERLKQLRDSFAIPMIFTLRSRSQGGYFQGSESERLEKIRSLAHLAPDYLDLEWDTPLEFVTGIASKHPNTKIILSTHDFTQTPKDLDAIYQDLQAVPASFYKVALHANDTTDALRLLCWAKAQDPKLIAISMGPDGQGSRILGPVVGCPFTYACSEEGSNNSLGQLPVKTLSDIYHHPSLTPQTAIYGLIGDPVSQSLSHNTHNYLMQRFGIDGVYVKMAVKGSELATFMHWAKELPFRGLSVTMPHKETIIPYLDQICPIAQEIGAVNTLLLEDGSVKGFNTDGEGALNALEKEQPVKDKRVVILGAGGAAKAIAYEAIRRGAHVTILNRHADKAKQVASQFSCVGEGLEKMERCFKEGYDTLINCTPVEMPIDPSFILPETVVMDIKSRPRLTTLLKEAEKRICRTIPGYRMFVEQAALQYGIWFQNRFPIEEMITTLDQQALHALTP